MKNFGHRWIWTKVIPQSHCYFICLSAHVVETVNFRSKKVVLWFSLRFSLLLNQNSYVFWIGWYRFSHTEGESIVILLIWRAMVCASHCMNLRIEEYPLLLVVRERDTVNPSIVFIINFSLFPYYTNLKHARLFWPWKWISASFSSIIRIESTSIVQYRFSPWSLAWSYFLL